MAGQPGTKKPNTAQQNEQTAIRLRENQRRSRARKKEYIASLEERLRSCQKMGVEANLELQSAARKVLFENYRLRELLRVKNVDEDEIEAFLRAATEDLNGAYEVERSLAPRPCSGLGGECCGGDDQSETGPDIMPTSDMSNIPSATSAVHQPPPPHQQPHQQPLQPHQHHQYAQPIAPQAPQLQNIQPQPYAPLRLRVPSPGSEGSSMLSPVTNSSMPYTPSSTASMQSPVQEPSFIQKPHATSMLAASQASYQPYGTMQHQQQPSQIPPLQNLQIAALQADQIPLPPSATSEFFPPHPQFQHHQEGLQDNRDSNHYPSHMQQQPSNPHQQPATGVTNCGVAYSIINQFMPGKSQSEIDMVTSQLCPPSGSGCCGDKGPQSGTCQPNAGRNQNVAAIAIPTSDQWDAQQNARAGRAKLDSCEVDNNTLFDVLDSLG